MAVQIDVYSTQGQAVAMSIIFLYFYNYFLLLASNIFLSSFVDKESTFEMKHIFSILLYTSYTVLMGYLFYSINSAGTAQRRMSFSTIATMAAIIPSTMASVKLEKQHLARHFIAGIVTSATFLSVF